LQLHFLKKKGGITFVLPLILQVADGEKKGSIAVIIIQQP
jgi:hypothetical protein